MEEIEVSEIVNENCMISKLGRIENPNDKTLGAATRVYASEPNNSKPVCISNSSAENHDNEFEIERIGVTASNIKFENLILDSPIGSKEIEDISEEIQVKGVKNAPQSKISENGISFSVEISGPTNVFSERNEVGLEKNTESEKSSNNDVVIENGSSSYGKDKNSNNKVLGKEKEAIYCDENNFHVGDLVWVPTKSNSWWPGLIMDPSYVCNIAPKPDEKASLLVKYFGNNPTIWCSPIKMKPFAENFEEMSSQGKSKVFISAVEKAVDEFGRQIKAQITCNCENGVKKDENFFLDRNILSRFEPGKFLHLVKNLAWCESKTERLELIKIQNNLSAFYRSLGHRQLPMNQLHEKTDDNKQIAKRGNKSKLKYVIGEKDSEVIERESEVKSEKGFESRERKRSKYLSYPYIDPKYQEEQILFKSSMKNLNTKKPQISAYKPKDPILLGELNTPLVDLLFKLRFAAVGCVFPMEKSGCDLVDRFFYGFRKWGFSKNYDPETEYKKESGNKSKDEFKFQEPVITPKIKRIKNNEKSSTNANEKFAPSTSGSFFENFEAPGSSKMQNLSESKKRKKREKKVPKLVQAEISMAVLPDLNINFTKQIPSVTDNNVNYAENGSFVKNVRLMGPRPAQDIANLNNGEGLNNKSMEDQLNNDGNKLKRVKKTWVMGLLAHSNDKPEDKKRERKEQNTKTKNQASTIPDLNQNATVAKSPKKKKRRNNKLITPQTDLNPCFSRVDISRESSGTALILTFAQGFPVPSKEALIATFCGFGPLNEKETKNLSDNRSAQVVFKNGLEAVEALKGIEKSSPFGPVLIKCQLRHLFPENCEIKSSKVEKAPDLDFIKRNLEMMTSTLERGGDNLSAEIREKLENEIKSLLKKVTMVGSTSSS